MITKKLEPPVTQAFFNPFPKYLQVRHILKRRMQNSWELGEKIPTEEALCKEFGVSRETVREALRGLEQEGLIQRHRAKGTFFVRRPDQPSSDRLTGLVEDFTTLKLDTHATVLAAGVMATPEEMQHISGAAEAVYHIDRLRYFEGQPLVRHQAFLPVAIGERVVALDLGHASITQILEETLGFKVSEERQQIEALVADTELAKMLEIEIGAPVLFISRLFRIKAQKSVVLFHSYYRADRYCYTLSLGKHRT